MAFETLDFYIKPSDGWVAVATDPDYLLIRPTGFHAWLLAITSGAAPSVNGSAATGTIILAGLPTADDTVTINGVVYKFVAALVDPFDVLIGIDATATGDNLEAAINGAAGEGTTYGTGTTASPDVTANNVAGTVTLTSVAKGTTANAITLAEAADNTTVSGATLTGGLNPVQGAKLGRGSDRRIEEYILDKTIAGTVYVKVPHMAVDGIAGGTAHFGVIRDQ